MQKHRNAWPQNLQMVAVPAAAGLFLLALPLVRLLFERGEFLPEDTLRTARMIRCYALGVWAYCALPVLVRGFYAQQDAHTPLRIGAKYTPAEDDWLGALQVRFR